MHQKKTWPDGQALWPWLAIASGIGGGVWSEHQYRSLPALQPVQREDVPEPESEWPGVSVIIPARNEQRCLPDLLASLVSQDYPRYEVIVVDDASTDQTAEIARHYCGCKVHVVQIQGPPRGWTGKNYACWSGAKSSRYPWLLFLDADVELVTPTALRATVAFALEHRMRALSLFPQQRCESFWERLLLPFILQQYFAGISTASIHRLSGPALANGQFLLLHRDIYTHIGGHAAQAASVIDDVEMATRLKRAGVVPFVCQGEQIAAVRMYTNLRQIREGFGKNTYLFLRRSPLSGLKTAIMTTLSASVLFQCYDALRLRSWYRLLLALLSYSTLIFALRSWQKRFMVPGWYALLAPLGSLLFLQIALESMLRVVMGWKVAWKGRRYRPGQ